MTTSGCYASTVSVARPSVAASLCDAVDQLLAFATDVMVRFHVMLADTIPCLTSPVPCSTRCELWPGSGGVFDMQQLLAVERMCGCRAFGFLRARVEVGRGAIQVLGRGDQGAGQRTRREERIT